VLNKKKLEKIKLKKLKKNFWKIVEFAGNLKGKKKKGRGLKICNCPTNKYLC